MPTAAGNPPRAGSGVQQELDTLASALARSVSLDDLEGLLLGYSIQGSDVDTARVEAILSRRVPEAVLAYQRRFGVDDATGPVRVPANPGLRMSGRTCLPVRRGPTTLALLWVLDEGRALDAEETRAVRDCAKRLCSLLAAPDARNPSSLLTAFLDDDPPPDLMDLIRPAMRSRGRRLQLVVVGTRPTRPPAPPPAASPAPFDTIAASAPVHGRSLMLIDAPRVSRGPAACLPWPDQNPDRVVGHSAPFDADTARPDRISALAAQAIVAADCAAVDPTLGRGTGWDDLGLYRRLLLTTTPHDWPGPQHIPEHGRSAEMLRHTLEVYLDHAGDAARSITALSIHRTTFYYRLDRLATLYGINLDDGLVRTEQHLALKTRRLATARDRYAWTPPLLNRIRLARDS